MSTLACAIPSGVGGDTIARIIIVRQAVPAANAPSQPAATFSLQARCHSAKLAAVGETLCSAKIGRRAEIVTALSSAASLVSTIKSYTVSANRPGIAFCVRVPPKRYVAALKGRGGACTRALINAPVTDKVDQRGDRDRHDCRQG